MSSTAISFLAIAVCLLQFSYALDSRYSGHQVWRIVPKTKSELRFLSELGQSNADLDFWKDPVVLGSSIDVRVSPEQSQWLRRKLKSVGLQFRITIPDVQELIDIERAAIAKTPRATSLDDFNYSAYHTADEIYEWMDWIVAQYSFITKVQMGVTFEGRPMYSLEIRKDPGVVKPVMYLDALIHCREWITAATAMYTLNEMLINSTYSTFLDDFDWFYIPMINVDGYVETWTGDRLWRKTRSTGASSACIGTDANRNFDDHWSGEGASANPCGNTFYGPQPASESETRHIQTYITGKGVDAIAALVTLHSYSQLILYPYNFDYVYCPDNEELNVTAKAQHDAIFAIHGKDYIYGPGASTIYICSGVTTDWSYIQAGIVLSYTYELRDTGEFGFELPADQIIPTGQEFIEGLMALTNHVKSKQ